MTKQTNKSETIIRKEITTIEQAISYIVTRHNAQAEKLANLNSQENTTKYKFTFISKDIAAKTIKTRYNDQQQRALITAIRELDNLEHSIAYNQRLEQRLNKAYGKEDTHPSEQQPQSKTTRKQQDTQMIQSQKQATAKTNKKISQELNKVEEAK